MSKINTELFSASVVQTAYGDCPECDNSLVIKYKGKSSFLGCENYPECSYTKAVSDADVTQLKIIEESVCPECNAQLAVKKGRFGMFIGCTNFPECHFISNDKQAAKADTNASVACPECKDGNLHKKQNRFGKFFYACNNYPKCKFIANDEPVDVKCERCDSHTMLKLAKKNILRCSVSSCKHEQEF